MNILEKLTQPIADRLRRKGNWEIRVGTYGEECDKWLKDGYEPFGVTGSGRTYVQMWFRKKVRIGNTGLGL